jgi:hypothetical protein
MKQVSLAATVKEGLELAFLPALDNAKICV